MEEYIGVLRKYVEFSGRSSRREYWTFILINMAISISLIIVGTLIKFKYLSNIYSLAVLLPATGVGIRRMHDVNESGWFSLIPFYNIYLAAKPGTKGQNKYGADPYGSNGQNPAAPNNLGTPVPPIQ